MNLANLCKLISGLTSLKVSLTGSKATDSFIGLIRPQYNNSMKWNRLAHVKIVAPVDRHQKLREMVPDRRVA